MALDKDQRESRRAAAQQGGKNRWHPPTDATPPDLSGAAFEVDGWIAYKDFLSCELQKRKIDAAEIEVETLQTRRDVERGKLFTRDQIIARDEAFAATLKERALSVTDLVASFAPPEKKREAQQAAHAWVDELLTAIADAIERQGEHQ